MLKLFNNVSERKKSIIPLDVLQRHEQKVIEVTTQYWKFFELMVVDRNDEMTSCEIL